MLPDHWPLGDPLTAVDLARSRPISMHCLCGRWCTGKQSIQQTDALNTRELSEEALTNFKSQVGRRLMAALDTPIYGMREAT